MDNVELQKRHYEKNFVSFEASLEALGWRSKTSQEVRFEVLASIGDLRGSSVLDVGCGFGDFYGYLKKKDADLWSYLGVDLVEGMVQEAYERYPEAEFKSFDILNCAAGFHDYVIASGIFGLESPTWDLYVRTMLTRMFEICKIGVGVNFLLLNEEKDSDSHYTNPYDMSVLARSISSKVRCILGYKVNDFTLFIYR